MTASSLVKSSFCLLKLVCLRADLYLCMLHVFFTPGVLAYMSRHE